MIEHAPKHAPKYATKHSLEHFSRPLLTAFTVSCCALLGLSGTQAQQVDAEFLRAISTIYAGGFTGQIIKEWCDERAPKLSVQNAKVLEAWRTKMDLPNIEARLGALVGAAGKDRVMASLEDKRSALYGQLDKSSTNPETDCMDLGTSLNDDFNLKVLYANEYKIVAAQPAASGGSPGSGTSIGSSMGAGSQPTTPSTGSQPVTGTPGPGPTGPGTAASKLPALPPFDFATFAKLGLDPEHDPIPDEYRCYARTPGDQYAIPQAILHVLPGRKYRFAYAGSIFEGSFALENGTRVVFNLGLLANQDKDYNKYNFERRSGASINLQKLVVGAKKIDFFCPQRGLKDQLEQLRLQRKDPPTGVFACTREDEPDTPIGTIELLPNRRYRTDGGEGRYSVDITGESGESSDVRFLDGPIPNDSMYYQEYEDGRQLLSLRQSLSAFRRITIKCVRKVKPRPNIVPMFGPNKAPSAPGKGGLEGRFFLGRFQVSIGGYTPCGGTCYAWAFFQKDGYVYTDDAEDTGGIEDIDCRRTYPSGFPICQTYLITGNTIKIGFEKPVPFKRIGNTVEIDGDEYGVLEDLDGLKFNGFYASLTAGSSSGGVSSSGFTSSVDLALRQDGRFSRNVSNKNFSSASWQGDTTVLATSGSGSSNTGTYRVYGNTIEFKYADGRVVKQFIFSPGGRKDLGFLRIDGRLYWLEKGSK